MQLASYKDIVNNYWKEKAQYLCTKIAMRRWLKSPQFCRAVEIETMNRCNGQCEFCPVNRVDDPRSFAQMDDDLLQCVLLDLHTHDYAGFLGLQSNNEPLMDKNIVKRIALARKMCPKSHLYMYTNGLLLTYDLLLSIFEAGMDNMVIDNYDKELRLHPHIKDALENLENSKYAWIRNRIEVSIVSPETIRSNRGGQAPNKQSNKFHDYLRFRQMGCMLPFNQLVIRPTGEVSLCCQDALGKYTLGNAREMTLDEIWYGPKFAKVRFDLSEKGRVALSLCQHCDVPPIQRADAVSTMLNFVPWRKASSR
jgi:radical SAM protein with 4Fe4S-binding SPASM domain